MRKWHFYDLRTGLFTGVVISPLGLPQPERVVDLPGGGRATLPATPGIDVPVGCGAVEWPSGDKLDIKSRRVNLKTGEVEAFQPDPPADDELRTWQWDLAAERWQPVPTDSSEKLQRQIELKGAILDREAAQARPLRELLLAISAGKQVPTDAAAKLAAIEADVVALRDEINTANKPAP